MKPESYLPSEILRPFIRNFMIIECEGVMNSNILPDTAIAMAFRFRGNVSYTEANSTHQLPPAVITGIRRSARSLTYDSKTSNLIVLFREGGAAAFFKTPLYELSEKSVALDLLMQQTLVRETEERLCEARTNPDRIAVIEQLLLSQLKDTSPDPLIATAIQKIRASGGMIRIGELAEALHISTDPLEKRFRRITGTTPKQFSGIVRLNKLISTHSSSEALLEAALEAGYFDQSHFIRSFKTFTGRTPLDFFRDPRAW